MANYSRSKQEPDRFASIQFGRWVGLNVQTYLGYSNYYIQVPRTSLPLPYDLVRVQVPAPPTDVAGADRSIASTCISNGSLENELVRANNKAYDRLINNLESVRANLALTLLEYEKSLLMISTRVGQLLSAFRAIKRFDYRAARRHLTSEFHRGSHPRSSKFTKSGTAFANGWNEVNFGWGPLLQDVHDAIHVLASPPPGSFVTGHATETFLRSDINPDRGSYTNMTVAGRVGVRHSIRVRCSNPNLMLLSQLGLVNPAYVAWDAVPFSFVIDWFIPVGKFLRSFTDFVGLEITHGMTTQSWAVTDRSDSIFNPGYVRQSSAWHVKRSLGTPAFRFPSEIQYKHGLWRQVTASALAVQKLSNMKVGRTRLTPHKNESYTE